MMWLSVEVATLRLKSTRQVRCSDPRGSNRKEKYGAANLTELNKCLHVGQEMKNVAPIFLA